MQIRSMSRKGNWRAQKIMLVRLLLVRLSARSLADSSLSGAPETQGREKFFRIFLLLKKMIQELDKEAGSSRLSIVAGLRADFNSII